MRRLLLLLAALLPAALPGLARAEEPAKIKIALLDLKVSGEISPQRVTGLGSLLASELSRESRLSVITAEDIRALVGLEKQKELLGCGDSSCLAELGGALGADYVLSAELAQIGSTYLFSASLVGMKSAAPVKRLSKPAANDDVLIGIVQGAVPELIAAIPEIAAVRGTAPDAATSGTVTPSEPGSSIPAWACIGGGVVLAGVGAYFYASALGVQSDYEAQQEPGAEPTIWIDDAKQAEFDAMLGLGLVGTGVVAGVVGVLLFPDDPAPASTAALLPAPGPLGLAGGTR